MTAPVERSAECGGGFAIWLIREVALRCGRPFTRLFLYPICLYFFFRRAPERRASRAFLTRVFGRPASAWQVLRHIHGFASTILDRAFLLAGRHDLFDIRVAGADAIEAAMRDGRGALLVGAHVGSFEILRALGARQPGLAVRAVLDTTRTPNLSRLLHALNPGAAGEIIDAARPAAEVALAIDEGVSAGALVTLLADRARAGEATLDAAFLGAPAHFPVAPYLVASALQVPIVLAFGIYRGGNRYDVHFERFPAVPPLPRPRRAGDLQPFVDRFAACLEQHVRHAPYNWFNFDDFWNPSPGPVAAVRVGIGGEPRCAA